MVKRKVPGYKQPMPQVEPMVLEHELIEISQTIKELSKKKHQILRQLKKQGHKPTPIGYHNKPIFLYALRLETDFYYIGMTRNPEKRLARHKKGKGSMWSKQYKVIEMFDIRPTNTNNDSDAGKMEDDMTIEYVMKYGSDKVRGGGYCQRKPRWPDVVVQNELPY